MFSGGRAETPVVGLQGAPRRHGWTQLRKPVRLDPGRGPGTDFEPIFSFQCLNSPSSEGRREAAWNLWRGLLVAAAGSASTFWPRRSPG